MPYQMKWIPPEVDMKVIKTEDLPDETNINGFRAFFGEKEWHKCSMCKGWIEGRPGERREDSMGGLCGRRGRVTYCRRCGHEISFFGARS